MFANIQQLKAQPTFQRKDFGIWIHKCRVRSNRPPQRLIGHIHIDNDNAILRCCFPHAYILIRFHGDMRERDELWADPNARKLHAHQIT